MYGHLIEGVICCGYECDVVGLAWVDWCVDGYMDWANSRRWVVMLVCASACCACNR